MQDMRIPALHHAYANGLSPDAVVGQVFERIEAAKDPGIFISLRKPEEVLAEARALAPFEAKSKPLWGIPFAVKDNIDTAGLMTTAGCPAYAYMPKKTAFAVQKLIDAGALLIGKTNLDQFATGLVGVRTPYPVPRNALSDDLIPGGSSSGSAVAVAHGIVSFSLGTDTAGSGRVPAALNNIVGLKPSLGAVSANGVVPACKSLDCVSVFALTVDDAWAAYSAMAGYDPDDSYSRRIELSSPAMPPNLRIGVPASGTIEFFGDRNAERAFAAGLQEMRRLGFSVTEIDFAPFRETAAVLYEGPWVAERYQAIRAFIEEQPEAMHPVTRAIIGGASRFKAADAFEGLYRLAALRRKTEGVWNGIDVLAVPSIPAVYTRAEVEKNPVELNSNLGIYTNFVNLLDLCALAVPGKFRDDGLPAGVTLIAPRGKDGMLAAVGRKLHEAAGVSCGATSIAPNYPDLPPSAPPGWIELAVVGAHLSGLPLNHELQSLGAIFLREAQTRADYKLFALPGAIPKPGMLRVAEGTGSSIACEVWALPAGSLGKFVAAIPSPLGIGTLSLADGTNPKGFLVEAEGVKSAPDISGAGGWRNYVSKEAGKPAPKTKLRKVR